MLGALFDLDGVVAETGSIHRQAWQDITERHGLAMSDEMFRTTFGMQNERIIPMLDPKLGPRDIQSLSAWKEQRYRDLVADSLVAPAGLRELLGDLRAHAFRLAVGSSAPLANIDIVLDTLGLRSAFDAIVSGEEIAHGKPAPDTFLAAAQRVGVAPEKCVVIEDAVQGVQAGQSAGMRVIAITTTRSRAELALADRVIDCLSEISAIDLQRLIENRPSVCP